MTPRRSAGAVLLSRTGKTLQEIAGAMAERGQKVSIQTVSLWSAGDTRPRPEKRVVLQDLFGVPVTSWDEKPTDRMPIRPRPADDAPPPANPPPSGVLAKAVALERICDEMWSELTNDASTPAERAVVGKTIADVLYKLARLPTARLTQHPDWPLVRRALRDALREHPDAARAVEEHMLAIEEASAA